MTSLPFETYQTALEHVAKAVLVFSAHWVDPTRGIEALWADSQRVYGLVISRDAVVPEGFRVETQIGDLRAVVPDLSVHVGREIQAQLDRTQKPAKLSFLARVTNA